LTYTKTLRLSNVVQASALKRQKYIVQDKMYVLVQSATDSVISAS